MAVDVVIHRKRTGDAALSISGSKTGQQTKELDLGKNGYGEVAFTFRVNWSVTADLVSVSKSEGDWFDDVVDDEVRSKNPPWSAIEAAIRQYIAKGPDYLRQDVIEIVCENL